MVIGENSAGPSHTKWRFWVGAKIIFGYVHIPCGRKSQYPIGLPRVLLDSVSVFRIRIVMSLNSVAVSVHLEADARTCCRMDLVDLPDLSCSHCGVSARCFVGDDGQIFWQCGQCGDILTWGQWMGFDGPSAAAEEDPAEPASVATSSVGASSSSSLAGVPLQTEEERARASRKLLVDIKVAYICAACEVLGIVPEDEGMTAWTDQQISTTIQQLKQRLAFPE
jgi:hypothetical protein